MNAPQRNIRVVLGPEAREMVPDGDGNPQQALETGIKDLKQRITELEEQLARSSEPQAETPSSDSGSRPEITKLIEALAKQEQQLWAMRESLISQLKMTRICVVGMMEKRGGPDMDELIEIAIDLTHSTAERTKLMTSEERKKHDAHEQELQEQTRQILDRAALEKFEEREEELER